MVVVVAVAAAVVLFWWLLFVVWYSIIVSCEVKLCCIFFSEPLASYFLSFDLFLIVLFKHV